MTHADINLQVVYQGRIRIVEARFYFRANVGGIRETLVLCSLYSPPDESFCEETYNALKVFEYYGTDALVVIRATDILSVVAMIPFREGCPGRAPWFFLIEKFALGVSSTTINIGE